MHVVLQAPRTSKIAAPMITARNTEKSVRSTLAGPKSLIHRSPALPMPPKKTRTSLPMRASTTGKVEAHSPDAHTLNIRPIRKTHARATNSHRSISVSSIAVHSHDVSPSAPLAFNSVHIFWLASASLIRNASGYQSSVRPGCWRRRCCQLYTRHAASCSRRPDTLRCAWTGGRRLNRTTFP